MPTSGARSTVKFKYDDRPLLDTTIDQRYFVEQQLAAVPAGVLYQARQLVLRLPVALVVVERSLSQRSQLVKDFKAEVAEAARLNSPHAMLVTDLGRVPDRRLYFTRGMQPGESLEAHLAGAGRLAEADAVAVLEQVEDVLSEMHAVELVHRALRPDQVFLLERRGRQFVKLLGVGCGALAAACEGASTSRYSAPEQLTGSCDERSDVYSLALIAHEMVSGSCPVAEAGAAPSARSPLEMAPGLSESYAEAVAAALDPDPRRRPSSARKLVDDLARAARSATPKRQVVLLPTASVALGLAAATEEGAWGKGGGQQESLAAGRVPARAFAELLRAGTTMPKPATRPHRPTPGEAMTLQSTLPDGEASRRGWVPVPSAVGAEMGAVRSVAPRTVSGGAAAGVTAVSGVVESAPPEQAVAKPGEGELAAVPEATPAEPTETPPLEPVHAAPLLEEEPRAEGGEPRRPILPRVILAASLILAVSGAIWLVGSESDDDPAAGAAHEPDGALARVGAVDAELRRPPAVALAEDAGAAGPADVGVVVAPRPTVRAPARRVWRPRRAKVGASRPPKVTPDAAVAGAAADAAAILRETTTVILDAARKAYVAGLYEQSLITARRLLRLRPNHREALQIVGASACHLSNLKVARDAYRRLSARRRGLLVSICQRRGLSLTGEPITPPPKGPATKGDVAAPASGGASGADADKTTNPGKTTGQGASSGTEGQ